MSQDLIHISDEDLLSVAHQAQSHFPHDYGGIVDIGSQFGRRIQAGMSREQAFYEVGEWIQQFYGVGNPWPLPEVHRPSHLIQGRLQYQVGGVWHDDHTPVVPLFCHYMDAFSKWTRGAQDEVRSQCEAIREAGYQGIRVLDVLGYYSFWNDREVSPLDFRGEGGKRVGATPDYYGQLREFILMLHDMGLKLMHDRGDLNGLTSGEALGHMINVGEIYRDQRCQNTLAGLWACNEAWQNGARTVEDCARLIRGFGMGSNGWYPDTIGLSCPKDSSEEVPDIIKWGASPATVYTVHGNRVPNEHIIAHYLGYGHYIPEIARTGKRTWNTEPVGGGEGVSVGRVDDAELLVGIAAEALLSGQAFTFMSGAGVKSDRPLADEPGFRAVGRLSRLLPRDLHTFTTIGHSGGRFRGTRIVAANDRTPTRADYAIHDDGRFVMNVYGEGGELSVERPFVCSIHNPAEDHVVENFAREPGQTFPGGYRHARLLIGELA